MSKPDKFKLDDSPSHPADTDGDDAQKTHITFDAPAEREKQPERVGIREVAREAGVSVATVSMVMNNNPRISRATHLRVQKMIERLGYRPNRMAQSLSGRYTQSLAVMLPPLRHAFADAYFGEILSGIADRAGKLGHKLLLEQAKPQFIREGKHLELFERRFVDGVLCLGFNEKHRFLEDFCAKEFPAVIVDNRLIQTPCDFVVCDYRLGAQQAMNCLLQLGHRNIGLIYAAPESFTAREVADVYLTRLQEADCPTDATRRHDGCFTDEGGAAAAARILAAHPDTTAVFCGNDKMALGALRYLTGAGKRVPQDVSVIGCDDIQHLAYVSPSLTTVHLPLYDLGVLACDKLVEKIRGKSEHIAETLPTHLVLRESTGIVPTRNAESP
ncbi:MAG: LacI family DNA-binding transcriptional regulator [Phycisphaerae bacterium]